MGAEADPRIRSTESAFQAGNLQSRNCCVFVDYSLPQLIETERGALEIPDALRFRFLGCLFFAPLELCCQPLLWKSQGRLIEIGKVGANRHDPTAH